MTLNDLIEVAVLEAIEAREPAANITAPLLNMLARVLVGTAAASGAQVSDLLAVAEQELTEAVAHYQRAPAPTVGLIELWVEGYAATGESGTARRLGTYRAETLADAVKLWTAEAPAERDRYVNVKNLTYWGCRFFDNEIDARRNFG